MRPVGQAGPVSEISPHLEILVNSSMCSYKRAVWLGYRDLGLSNRVADFAIRILQSGYRKKIIHCITVIEQT